MELGQNKYIYAIGLSVGISLLLILRQYTDYLINDYGYDFSWFAVSTRILINYTLWGSFFALTYQRFQRFFNTSFGIRKIISIIGISILISLAHRVCAVRLYDLTYYLESGFMRDFFTPGNQVEFGTGWITSFIEFWIVQVIIIAFGYYSRYLEQEKELNQAKLSALKMQLQPHFLFNTLNSITALIDIDTNKAQRMLSKLGFLMREILEHDKEHLISLETELTYIKTYLEIEHIRFQDRLELNFKFDENVIQASIPALLLQPIVENAIKHGVSKNPSGGMINLTTAQIEKDQKEFLSIEVSNTFHLNGHKPEGFGIGTANVGKRLDNLYGKNHLYKNTIRDNLFTVQIEIPLTYLS